MSFEVAMSSVDSKDVKASLLYLQIVKFHSLDNNIWDVVAKPAKTLLLNNCRDLQKWIQAV